ncbi:unnamed protein product [Orchesella dallaii]|uniref:Vacuolar protein sorting-associated protein 33B n=1 Tax=Orchesella dallaii TaxID=48710 RepID=A0ABP1R9W7_9HEXA
MPPDIGLIRGVSRENLSRALRLKRGKKILIIDSKLTATLDLIANFRFLQDHGVEKVFQLEKCGPPQPIDSINQCLYLIRSDLMSARLVCDQINSNLNRNVQMTYGVIVVPRLLHVISTLFESEGIYEHVTLGQYAYELIPIEDHVLSLEFDDIVAQLWLHKDTSYLAPISKALFNIRGIYGDFSHVVAVGHYSQNILRMQVEYERIYTNNLKAHNRQESDIPTLIIVDRDIDFVTPMMIPLSYEAVLDEIFGIKGRIIMLGSEVTGKEPVKHNIPNDKVFEKVRNLHFSQVVSYLIAQEKETRRLQDGSAGLNLQQMKKFVSTDLQKIQALKKMLVLHFGAFDAILHHKKVNLKKLVDLQDNIIDNVDNKETINYLEDAMARSFDATRILRLFCLSSLAQDGLRDSKNLKTQFIQSYGYKHLITLHNLEKMGLLYNFKGLEVNAKGMAQVVTKVASASPFSSSATATAVGSPSSKTVHISPQAILKKSATPSNIMVDLVTANHSSYIFNGKFSPFVAKLTEEVLSVLVAPKMNSALAERKIDDHLKGYHIPEKLTSVKFKATSEAYGRGRNALVFVVGGITRGEVAALQTIGRNIGFNIICAGTDITNGTKIINLATTS